MIRGSRQMQLCGGKCVFSSRRTYAAAFKKTRHTKQILAYSCLLAAYLVATHRLPGVRAMRRCLKWASVLTCKSDNFISLSSFVHSNVELSSIRVVRVLDVTSSCCKRSVAQPTVASRQETEDHVCCLPQNTVCIISSIDKIEVYIKSTASAWSGITSDVTTGELNIHSERNGKDLLGNRDIEVNIFKDVRPSTLVSEHA